VGFIPEFDPDDSKDQSAQLLDNPDDSFLTTLQLLPAQ
jgi:hypothetical protein